MTDPHAEARRIAGNWARLPIGADADSDRKLTVARAYFDLSAREGWLREALDAGRRFERAYQESLGATPTTVQWERLDSLQGRFIDLYTAALSTPEEDAEARAEHLREAREVEAWQEAKHARREEDE